MDPQTVNWQGIGIVIGAVAAAIPVVGGFVLNCLTYRRQAKRDAKIDAIDHKVDGLGDHREALALRAGTAEGHAKGVKDERADPQSPVGA